MLGTVPGTIANASMLIVVIVIIIAMSLQNRKLILGGKSRLCIFLILQNILKINLVFF